MFNRISFSQIYLRPFFWILAFVLLVGCTQTDQLTSQEKSMLITEQDFIDFEISKNKKTHGKFNKQHTYIDHNTTLEYETTINETVYLLNTFSLEKNHTNAVATAFSMRTGALIGLKLGDMANEEIPLKNQYNGKATLLLLKINKEPVGNIFTYVHEKKVWFAIFTGFYYDKAKDFETVFAPQLEKIQAFSSFDD